MWLQLLKVVIVAVVTAVMDYVVENHTTLRIG